MARNPHRPTEQLREAVKVRAGMGQTQDSIARYLRIDEKTLRKYYRDELLRGPDEANAQVASAIFNAATGREVQDDGTIKRVRVDSTLAIWWSKTRMGWKEPPRDQPSDVVPLAINGPNATIIVKGGLPQHPGAYTEDEDFDTPVNGSAHGSNGTNGTHSP